MPLFRLLRSAIIEEPLTDNELDVISTAQLHPLLQMSYKHDLSHLFVLGLQKNGLISQMDVGADNHILKAVYRYEKMKYAYDTLCLMLEKSRIPFLPLKGWVIQQYYPEPWMRTSCDIDILIHREDVQKAFSLLENELGYIYRSQESHDISFFSPDNVHLELHYDLIEAGRVNRAANVLSKIWDTAVVRNGFTYWYEMTDEMFYFYHIAHMAKHFEIGGCGIKPFVDLFILDNLKDADYEKRNDLLKQGDLLQFANAVRKLSGIWFLDEDRDYISQQMENYILVGGVYGNDKNRIAVQQMKQGGRLRYFLSKIFLPYEVLKFQYPVLQQHRWLLPLMEVCRWCKLVFCGHAKRIMKEFKDSQIITEDETTAIKHMLFSIGLWRGSN